MVASVLWGRVGGQGGSIDHSQYCQPPRSATRRSHFSRRHVGTVLLQFHTHEILLNVLCALPLTQVGLATILSPVFRSLTLFRRIAPDRATVLFCDPFPFGSSSIQQSQLLFQLQMYQHFYALFTLFLNLRNRLNNFKRFVRKFKIKLVEQRIPLASFCFACSKFI